jgi:hypothetical protein
LKFISLDFFSIHYEYLKERVAFLISLMRLDFKQNKKRKFFVVVVVVYFIFIVVRNLCCSSKIRKN